PTKNSRAGRDMRGRLQQVGIFRNTGHEHFNGCVVFPILAGDGTGRIVDIYGRKTRQHGLHRGLARHLYLAGERRGVWNVTAFGATEEIILCPSIFDALTFWCQGYRNVTCTLGPDALTQDHLAAFKEFQIKRILLIAESIAGRLLDAGLDCFLLRFPPGQDANAYALRAKDPAEALGAIL